MRSSDGCSEFGGALDRFHGVVLRMRVRYARRKASRDERLANSN